MRPAKRSPEYSSDKTGTVRLPSSACCSRPTSWRLILELGALLLMGLGVGQGVSIDGLLQGRDNGWRLAILLIAVLIDLFLTSPLRAGQAAYFRLVADPGPPPLRPVTEVTG